jgi:hypothetical protein
MRVLQRLARIAVATSICAHMGVLLADDSHAKLPLPSHDAKSFRCSAHACSMPSQGQYPYIVIGLYQATASAGQSEQLFTDMRAHHFWSALPDDPVAFYANLQPVSIALPNGKALALLMAQDEFKIAKPQPGDLVRYSAHFGTHEMPPNDPKARAYWSVDGCVAVICREDDKACFGRYAQGVFRRPDGIAISPNTFNPVPNGTAIDVDSLLPKHKS